MVRERIFSILIVAMMVACAPAAPSPMVVGDPVREMNSFVTFKGSNFIVTSKNHAGHALVAVQREHDAPKIALGHWNDGLAYVADGSITVGGGEFGDSEGRILATNALYVLGNALCASDQRFEFSPGEVVDGAPRPEAMFQGQVSAWIFGGACK